MLVDRVESAEEFAKGSRPDGDHQRKPNRGVDRVTATDPIPELEHVGGVNSELGNFGRVGADGDEVLRHGAVAQGCHEPATRLVRVREGLDGGEGLGTDHHQRRGRIEIGKVRRDVRAVDVADEAATQTGLRKGLGRQVRHRRAKVATTNADIDHCLDAFSGRAEPLAATHAVCERCHAIEHAMHLSDNIVTVDDQLRRSRRAQRGVKDRSILGRIDVRAGEHRIAPRLDLRSGRDAMQRCQHPIVDQMLGIVDAQITSGQHIALATLTIGRKQFAQMRRRFGR